MKRKICLILSIIICLSFINQIIYADEKLDDISADSINDRIEVDSNNAKIYYGNKMYYFMNQSVVCEKDGEKENINISSEKILKLALVDNKIYIVTEKDNHQIEWILIDDSLNTEISLMSVTGNSNEEQIFAFCRNTMGINTAASCGVLANIYCESSFRPTAHCIDTNGLTSYGICQWNGGRFTALKNYCAGQGLDYRTLSGQLSYLKYELEHSEASAYKKFKNVSDDANGAYNAGYNWARYFERCAKKYYAQRAKLSQDTYYPNYAGVIPSGNDIPGSANNPEGCIDVATGGIETIRIAGWAFDYDEPNTAIDIHVYVGGPAGSGAPGYDLGAASNYRPDVSSAYGIGNNHGFDRTIDVDRFGEQTIYIYGINVGGGDNVLIGEERVNIYQDTAMHDPEGCIDTVSGGFGSFSISGWTFDYDDKNSPLNVHIYVGGPAGSGAPGYNMGTAEQSRPDVADVYGVGENHGFSFSQKVDRYGEQTLYIYAINVGKGTNSLIGTETITIQEPYRTNVESLVFENNKLKIDGWAICGENNNNIKIAVQIDDMPEIDISRYFRNDVHNAYSNYPSGNEGFSATIDGKNLRNGSHIAVLNAHYDDKTIELGKIEFTSYNDHKPQKTIVKNNHIYSIFDASMDWVSAEKLAENKGGNLITISSDEEQNIVKKLLEYGALSQYWIGALKESGKWEWVNGESVNYTNWHEGEPDNCDGNEYYAGLYSNGTWNDFSGTVSDIGYIMETEISGEPADFIENDGHYYYLYDNETDWYGAKSFCEAMGGHLVTINDKKEQAMVQSLVNQRNNNFKSYFIGATNNEDGSTWKWVTDEEFNYTNWDSGEPNTANGIEHYAEIYTSGKWNDRESFNDGEKNGFICEIEQDDTYTVKTEYGNNTYLRIDKSLSWTDAKKYCEALGGHLATITDEDEQEAVGDLLCRGVDTLRSAYAIGGTDQDGEGAWKWITDEQFDYTNWDNGSDSSNTSQNFLTISSQNGMWADSGNFSHNPYDIGFICEIEDNAQKDPKPVVTPKPDIDKALSTLELGTVSAKVGETVKVPLKISNNQGICESKFVLNYDNTKITPISVDIDEKFSNGSIQSNIENITADSNSLTVTWENSAIADNTENSNIFIVTFKISDNAETGSIPITIDKSQLEIINASGDSLNVNIIDGSINIEEEKINYGDVNGDGKINIIDIVLLRKYNANLPVDISENGLLAADVNVDGHIDSKDILLLRKYVAKWNNIVLGK